MYIYAYLLVFSVDYEFPEELQKRDIKKIFIFLIFNFLLTFLLNLLAKRYSVGLKGRNVQFLVLPRMYNNEYGNSKDGSSWCFFSMEFNLLSDTETILTFVEETNGVWVVRDQLESHCEVLSLKLISFLVHSPRRRVNKFISQIVPVLLPISQLRALSFLILKQFC